MQSKKLWEGNFQDFVKIKHIEALVNKTKNVDIVIAVLANLLRKI